MKMIKTFSLLSCLMLVAANIPVLAQPTIRNASFEADATPPHPGYGAISDWMPSDGGTGYGLNEGGGPFADNGQVPDGTRVAFMQNNGTLSQTVSGFVPGERYWLVYRENARGLCCGERMATLAATVGSLTVVAEHEVAIVGGSNPYRLVTSSAFTAAEAQMTLTFAKGGFGDSTALIDDVRILGPDSLQLGISLSNGFPIIQIRGIPGRMLTLEFKNVLVATAAWQTSLNVLLTNGSTNFVDSDAPSSHPRFYRATQEP